MSWTVLATPCPQTDLPRQHLDCLGVVLVDLRERRAELVVPLYERTCVTAHRRAMRATAPGRNEFEVEAVRR